MYISPISKVTALIYICYIKNLDLTSTSHLFDTLDCNLEVTHWVHLGGPTSALRGIPLLPPVVSF